MTTRSLSGLSVFLLAWALVFGRLDLPVATAAGEPLLVIVGLTFPVDDIDLADLKSAFRGKHTYVAGKRLIPINHALKTPLRDAFDRAILGLEGAAVGRYWIDRQIRDEGQPPVTVRSADLAVRAVAALPGGISYATRALLTAKVKTLSIEGKSAGQSGYALAE